MPKRLIILSVMVVGLMCFSIVSPVLIGRVVAFRTGQQLSKGLPLGARVSIVEWGVDTIREESVELLYIAADDYQFAIANHLKGGQENSWIMTTAGLWAYEPHVPVLQWHGDAPATVHELNEYLRIVYFLDELQGAKFGGREDVNGITCYVIFCEDGPATHYFYLDRHFVLQRYLRTAPNNAYAYTIHHRGLMEGGDIVAVPATVPLRSIWEPELSLAANEVAVEYDLAQVLSQQQYASQGDHVWRQDPFQVALAYIESEFPAMISQGMNVTDLRLADGIGPTARISIQGNFPLKYLTLAQLAEQGVGGVWTVVTYQYHLEK